MLFRQKTTASVLWAEPVVEPATVGIPERTVHATIPACHKERDMILKARHRGDGRSRRYGEAVTKGGIRQAEPVVEPATVGIPERTVHATFHEIGSWRVTSFSEGLARVIETDSPRSRTLVVSTFPTPLSQMK